MYCAPNYYAPHYLAPIYVGSTGVVPSTGPNPNPRRTIDAECYGFVGVFTSYWTTDNDVATFDLTFILAAGETVTVIDTFGLTVEGPTGAVDPDPATRALGSSGISEGTAVSQRFGNWQPNVVQIIYRVDMVCTTSFGNTLSVYAYVTVNQPPGFS